MSGVCHQVATGQLLAKNEFIFTTIFTEGMPLVAIEQLFNPK
jgi:hypothetical protein